MIEWLKQASRLKIKQKAIEERLLSNVFKDL